MNLRQSLATGLVLGVCATASAGFTVSNDNARVKSLGTFDIDQPTVVNRFEDNEMVTYDRRVPRGTDPSEYTDQLSEGTYDVYLVNGKASSFTIEFSAPVSGVVASGAFGGATSVWGQLSGPAYDSLAASINTALADNTFTGSPWFLPDPTLSDLQDRFTARAIEIGSLLNGDNPDSIRMDGSALNYDVSSPLFNFEYSLVFVSAVPELHSMGIWLICGLCVFIRSLRGPRSVSAAN